MMLVLISIFNTIYRWGTRKCGWAGSLLLHGTGFSEYHQIKITLEDRSKTKYATKWGCFQYTVMPFGLKNALVIFSCIVVATFKEFIHKFLEVYLDDWTVFGLVKKHVTSLWLMLDTCCRHHIVLNLKKCTFLVAFRNMLGHVVCKQELMVDLEKTRSY